MPKYTIELDALTFTFYEKIARQAELPVEQVLSDTLFRYAGELSLHAMRDREDLDGDNPAF